MIDGEPEHIKSGSKLKRGLLIALLAFLAIIIIVLGFVWYSLARLSINPLNFRPLAQTDGRTNVLVLGVGDPGHPGEQLSDTMMVISLDRATKQVAMISMPRDMRVAIPGHGSGKINSANVYGGPALAEQTVANTLGIPIHYYIETDFSGLKTVVDAVGGLDIDVKEQLKDASYPCESDSGYCGLNIQPGQQHMDGKTVLAYSRCRKGTCGNDFGRAARQQEVIQALEKRLGQKGVYLNPKTATVLLNDLHQFAKTDLSVNDLISFGWGIHNPTRTIHFVFSTAPGGYLKGSGYSSDLLPVGGDYTQIQKFTQNIFSQPPPEEDQTSG